MSDLNSDGQKRGWWARRSTGVKAALVTGGVLVGGFAAMLILGLVLVALGYESEDDEPAAEPTEVETVTESPSPEPTTPEPEPEPTTEESEPEPSPDPTTPEPEPQPEAEPEMVHVDLLLANRYSEVLDSVDDRLEVDYYDLGPNLVEGVDSHRVVFDSAGWYVLGQCPDPFTEVPAGDTVTVGLVKVGELSPSDRAVMDAVSGDSEDLNYWASLIPCD